MKIKYLPNGNAFEADDDAAKELIARGDYEKATKSDESPSTEPAPPRKRKTK